MLFQNGSIASVVVECLRRLMACGNEQNSILWGKLVERRTPNWVACSWKLLELVNFKQK